MDRLSTQRATAILFGFAAAAAAVHAFFVHRVQYPVVFMDELGYERMAQTFAHSGHFSLFGKGGLAYSPLYPIVLSPIYALTTSMHTAYEWAKVENSVLFSLSVFPVYGMARSVLPRGRSIGVAGVSLLAPLLLYGGYEMSESLAYPLCLLAIWTMLRAARRPSIANDALMLAAIFLASTARIQLVALVPAAITAFFLVALAAPPPGKSRRHAIGRAASEHWALFGFVGVALIAGLVRTVMNGGNLPLAGRYASIGSRHGNAWRVIELFFQHLAELDFAVGVIPFAAALLAGYALVRSGFPRRALIFASVAVASSFWFLLEVALDAAAYDSTDGHPKTHSPFSDLPRIHERYLIYLVPFFLIALFGALRLLRKETSKPLHLAIAGISTLLPAVIPLGTVINGTTGIDSFSLLTFARTTHSGEWVPTAHATLAILALSALFASAYFLAAFQPFPALAVLMTAFAFVWFSVPELQGQWATPSVRALGLPAHRDWVDRAVGSGADVSLVGGSGVGTGSLRETAFWNVSIARVYYTCGPAFGPDFGEQQLAAGSAISARYATVPAWWHVSGDVLARNRVGKVVLIAPRSGRLRIPSALRCTS